MNRSEYMGCGTENGSLEQSQPENSNYRGFDSTWRQMVDILIIEL